MTALRLLAALALPSAAGWLLATRLLPASRSGPAGLALRLGLAPLLGAGAGSLLWYAWLLAGGGLGPAALAVDALAFLGAAVALARWRGVAAPAGPAPAPWRWPGWLAAAAAAAALLLVAASFASDAWRSPHGDWDAWAIWNLRARFLFRGGARWTDAFAPELAWSNLGYPLLVPTAVARLWGWAGEGTAAPVALAAVFALSPLLVLFGAVARRGGPVAAALGALLLAGTAEWLEWIPAQGADVAVAAYVAAAAGVLVVARGPAGPDPGACALAGALLGLAGWTKDEGAVLAVLLAGWLALAGGLRGAPGRLAALAAGAALPALARLHFQLALAPGLATALTGGQTAGGYLERLLDGGRWSAVLETVPPFLPGRRFALAAVAAAGSWALGARLRAVRASPLPALALAYLVYHLVYAVTPLPLEAHVRTSAQRVLLQPWPAVLLAILALAAPAPAGAAEGPPPVGQAGVPAPVSAPAAPPPAPSRRRPTRRRAPR